LFRESLRRCTRDVRSPIKDEFERNMLKRVSSGRSHAPEHIVTVLHSAYTRGAGRAAVEAPLRALLAEIADWYEQDAPTIDDVIALVRRETAMQALADVAEVDVVLDRDRLAVATATDRIDAHLVALEDLSAALHRRRVA
jgi:hypothetical protein